MTGSVANAVIGLLLRLQLVLSTVAFVLAVVAARGYAGTPWGRVLKPMPVIIGCMLAVTFVQRVLPDGVYWPVAASLLAVAGGAIALSTYRIDRLIRRGAQ